MLECFKDLVGAKTCGHIDKKHYLETLQLSVKHLAQIANGAQITAKDYVDAKVSEAIELVLADIAWDVDFVNKPIKHTKFKNYFLNTFSGYRGVTFQTTCPTERLYIDAVQFKGDREAQTTLRITDGDDITLINFTARANEVVNIPISQNFNTTSVKIEVDNTNVAPAQNYERVSECFCTDKTYGINVIGYTQCNLDLLLCQLSNISSFGMAVLYKTGALIEENRHFNSQMNTTIVTKVDDILLMADSHHKNAEKFTAISKNEFTKLVKQSCCYDCKDTQAINFIP